MTDADPMTSTMDTIHEVRDSDAARRYVLHGLWMQRVVPTRAATVRPALSWAFELAGSGEPLPPVGFIADVGHLAFDAEAQAHAMQTQGIPGWPAGLARSYEDQVLGKLYVDSSFERASAALSRYQGRDRVRGFAYLLTQLRQRAGFGGVLLSPSVIKPLLERPPAEVLSEAWESLGQDGHSSLLPELYESVVSHFRQVCDILGAEDVFELEHGMALAQFGQRVALRQVLHASACLEEHLPRQRPRTSARRHEVPTRMLDEDAYPVGGFSSLSTRGSIESLLHSQLAYMERRERPDLFDLKFLRDELLYYSRDENQFLRPRRSFVFLLSPELIRARFKDADLPYQRIILLLALIVTTIRRLTDWLSSEALHFECILPAGKDTPLAAEQSLLEMVLREQIANGTVLISRLPETKLGGRCTELARRSRCCCLTLSAGESTLTADATEVSRLRLNGPRPELAIPAEPLTILETDDHVTAWAAVLERLLQAWIA